MEPLAKEMEKRFHSTFLFSCEICGKSAGTETELSFTVHDSSIPNALNETICNFILPDFT
jgi:hypothetical protein